LFVRRYILKTNDNAKQRAFGHNFFRQRFVKNSGVLLIMTGLFLWYGDISPCNGASLYDGASLFQKHCSLCHTTALNVRSSGDVLDLVRTPPAGMPTFAKDRLSDGDAWAIGDYLRSSSPFKPATQDPASTGSVTEKSSPSGKSSKDKKSWMKGFGTPED
jgi:cytochrome c